MNALLAALVLAPFAGAGAPLLARALPALPAARGATLVLATTLALALAVLPFALQGPTPVAVLPWVPALGLELAFRGDVVGCGFTLLIVLCTGVTLARLQRGAPRPRAAALALAFTALAQGVVLATNLLVLVALTGLSGVAAWRLERAAADGAPRGAGVALLTTSAGSLALLAAVLLLGDAAGSFDLDAILAAQAASKGQSPYPAIVALLLAGVATRCAAWPWTGAPRGAGRAAPVAGALAGATLLATGVAVTVRLWPLLSGGVPRWLVALAFVAVPFLSTRVGRSLAAMAPPPAAGTRLGFEQPSGR